MNSFWITILSSAGIASVISALANLWMYKRKYKDDYYKMVISKRMDAYSKVEIVCPIHGSFYQIPKHHMNGSGCPMCDKSKKLNTKEFIKKAQAVHGNKYNYDKSNYIRAFEKKCSQAILFVNNETNYVIHS